MGRANWNALSANGLAEMNSLFGLIMDALVRSVSIDYSVICSWSSDVAEHDRALSQCDYYGVVVANRPSDKLQFKSRKEVVSCQTIAK